MRVSGRRFVFLSVLMFSLLATGFVSAQSQSIYVIGTSETNSWSLYDDFNVLNTSIWDYRSNEESYPYVSSSSVVFTGYIEFMYSQLLLKKDIQSDFSAEFRFYIDGGSTGADGIVLMFYKNLDYTPAPGKELGFDDGSSVEGFGVEIDTFANPFDPYESGVHIALIKDSVTNHLVSYNVSTYDIRGSWHTLNVTVKYNRLLIYLDGSEIIDYTSSQLLSRDYGGFGITASTGSFYDIHKIDWIRLFVSLSTSPPPSPGPSHPSILTGFYLMLLIIGIAIVGGGVGIWFLSRKWMSRREARVLQEPTPTRPEKKPSEEKYLLFKDKKIFVDTISLIPKMLGYGILAIVIDILIDPGKVGLGVGVGLALMLFTIPTFLAMILSESFGVLKTGLIYIALGILAFFIFFGNLALMSDLLAGFLIVIGFLFILMGADLIKIYRESEEE